MQGSYSPEKSGKTVLRDSQEKLGNSVQNLKEVKKKSGVFMIHTNEFFHVQ